MQSIFKNKKGFSLVELMVVVAIIGILSAIGVPRYQVFKAKAMQAEAKSSLSSIYTLQQAFFNDNDIYASDPKGELGWEPGANAKYTYTNTGGQTFKTTATYGQKLASCAGGTDVWEIDEDKTLCNATPGLSSCPGYNKRDEC